MLIPALRGFSRLPAHWQARLATLPGVLTFLSVLAVFLASQPHQHDLQPRVTAGTVTPVLPELRPAPQPSAPLPLPGSPAPEPYRVPTPPMLGHSPLGAWAFVDARPDLAWWGRRQTDGG